MTFSKRFLHYIVYMPRPVKQMLMLGVDVGLLLCSVWLAYALRLGDSFMPNIRQWFLMLTAPLLAVPVFVRAGLYRSVIRYVGEQALWSVMQAMTVAALLWATLAFMMQMTGIEGMPRTVPILYWLMGCVLIGGVRFGARWILWLPLRERYAGRQVLIYGAGDAGRQLVASLRQGRTFFPAGFLDDDSMLQGKDVAGIRVYAPSHISNLLERFEIKDVIVTLPSASHARCREVVSFLELFPVRVQILPVLSGIVSGWHLVSMLREVDVGDLLGRDAVTADPILLERCIRGKCVLVTGAGGSIGSELCRQIMALFPEKLILLEANEYNLYQIDRTLVAMAGCELISCLGSVENGALVNALLLEHRVQTVYHAAAHKHVPIVDANIIEGVQNNVFGTKVIAEAALAAGVETFVLISTDKAVRPTNVMGATKRWAELIVQDCAYRIRQVGGSQCFCTVRFGNVLGSSGSVIPLFREQIAHGGPVTVTHPEVTRYFMSIHEAVELVIQAGSFSTGGEVFLLDMGEPVKILELAHNMIRLAGRTVRDEHHVDGDIEIQITGLRSGEKLYEELLIASSGVTDTPHPKIMRAEEFGLGQDALTARLTQLCQQMASRNIMATKQLLMMVAEGHE